MPIQPCSVHDCNTAALPPCLASGDFSLFVACDPDFGVPDAAEQWIKEDKNAMKWTKLPCRTFKDNQARLQLFALTDNLGNFYGGLHYRNRYDTGR